MIGTAGSVGEQAANPDWSSGQGCRDNSSLHSSTIGGGWGLCKRYERIRLEQEKSPHKMHNGQRGDALITLHLKHENFGESSLATAQVNNFDNTIPQHRGIFQRSRSGMVMS